LESKFKLDGVSYTATGENLPSEKDWKYAVEGHWEHQNLVQSAKFLKERNGIIQAARNGKFSLLQYAVLLTESDKFRQSNFVSNDVSTLRTFSGEIDDDLGIGRDVTFRGETEIEELPALSLIEAYRTLPFGKDEFTTLVVGRYIAHHQQGTHPPLSYSNQEEFEAWLKTVDLRNDNETVSEFIDAMTETAQKFTGKFITDEAEIMRLQILRELPDIKTEWNKKAAEPFTSPTGLILGEQTADTRLQAVLEELAEEAYMTAQMRESKKGESFFTLLKGLFKRHEAVLLTPEDAKEAI
jgi:hypothetical protein